MSRYVKADMIGCPCGYCEGYDKCQKELDEAPSIDIVRCQDCKFSDEVITSWSTDGKNIVVERLCQLHKWSVKDDDFCSYAERKRR